jgi:hypothetical protein
MKTRSPVLPAIHTVHWTRVAMLTWEHQRYGHRAVLTKTGTRQWHAKFEPRPGAVGAPCSNGFNERKRAQDWLCEQLGITGQIIHTTGKAIQRRAA